MLKGKHVVLGVTGGIAAYKACEVVSRLRKLGADVDVIMTENATKLVAPLTFETLSRRPVTIDTFERAESWDVKHISLAQKADVMLVAPATANLMAKLAHGIADDMLTTTLLATKAPVLLAPAMNTGMWTAQATQENLRTLKGRGVLTVGPDSGLLACGDTGAGRMSEPEQIVEAVTAVLHPKRDMEGLKVLVTAGPTVERIDPVRYLTNDSSGKMGYALAQAARARRAGHAVVRPGASCGAGGGGDNAGIFYPEPLRRHAGPLRRSGYRRSGGGARGLSRGAGGGAENQEAGRRRACSSAGGKPGRRQGRWGAEKARAGAGRLCGRDAKRA